MQLNFPNGLKCHVSQVTAESLAVGAVKVQHTKEPSLRRQIWTYSKAVARWVAAGSPARSQTEIDAALAICKACEHYAEKKKPHCRVCGCQLNTAPDGLVNKIAMATEHCPLTPPKW